MARDKPATSALLGVAATWPLAGFWIVANFAHASPSSAKEAMIGILFIGAIGGLVAGVLAGIGLSRFWRLNATQRVPVALAAVCAGLAAIPLFAAYGAPHGWEGSFEDFPYVALIQGLLGGCLYCLLPHEQADVSKLNRGWLVGLGIAVAGAVYCYPDVAFRMRKYDSQLTWLERIGANRAADSHKSASQGKEALAQSGDPKQVSVLIEEIGRADIDGRGDEMVRLASRLESDQKVKDALVGGLHIALSRYRKDNTFDHVDRGIEAYCEALAQCVDMRAVPDLIKAYNLSKTQMNIRHAAAKTLGNVYYKDAEPFIKEELNRLHPMRDKETAKLLAGTHSGEIRSAYLAFQSAGDEQRSRLQERDVPVTDLIRRGDLDAIAKRALSNDRGADIATIELIKRKHPKRFAAASMHAGRWVRGNQLTTFRDPELAAYIMKKDLMKVDNWHLTRFLCEWAPIESCATLGRLLKTQFASAAVVGLAHCRHSDAPKLLLSHLRAYRPGDGALAHSLLRALGMRAYEPAAPLIGEWASGSKSAGSFVVDGTPVEVKEVARWALSRMGSSEARKLAAKYPVGSTEWVQKWKWQ